MDRYNRDIRSLKEDLTNFKNELESLNRNIINLESKLTTCNNNIYKVQADIGNIRRAIEAVLDAKFHWKKSAAVTQAANKKTTSMEKKVNVGKRNPSKFVSATAN